MVKNNKNNKNDNARAKAIVAENLKRMGKQIYLSDIVEIIRPLYTFRKDYLVEKELKAKGRYIMSRFRDAKNVRTYFSDNTGVYINVENTTNLGDLDKVDAQLSVKYRGLTAAIAKVRGRLDTVVEKFKRNK